MAGWVDVPVSRLRDREAQGVGDHPGGDPDALVESLVRLMDLEDPVGILPGHGRETTIGAERPWLELVKQGGRLPI